MGPLVRHQRGEVSRHLHRRRPRLSRRAGGQDGLRPGAEVGPIRVGDAEQLADHGDRQREGERFEQVDLTAGGHRVQQRTGDLGDARPQPLDAAGRERPGDQAPKAVMVGGIRAEHVRVKRSEPVIGFGGGIAGPQRAPVFDQPRIGQRGAGLRVPRDNPDGMAAGHHNPAHRALGSQPLVHGVGVLHEPVAELLSGGSCHDALRPGSTSSSRVLS
jgi:hypothetical protein